MTTNSVGDKGTLASWLLLYLQRQTNAKHTTIGTTKPTNTSAKMFVEELDSAEEKNIKAGQFCFATNFEGIKKEGEEHINSII